MLTNALQARGAATESLIVNISRQGLIYLSAMFVLGAIFRETCLIWAQPVEDVLFLLGAGLYFRIRAKHKIAPCGRHRKRGSSCTSTLHGFRF